VPSAAKALAIPIGAAIGYRRATGQAFEIKGMKTRIRRGVVIFRKRAHIPAAAARPFIKPSIDEVQPFFYALHSQYFKELFPKRPMVVKVKVKGTEPTT
jgi:hypothetical protein